MIQLEKLFSELGHDTPEQRAAFVKWMLGENDRSCPFYYRECKAGKAPAVHCMLYIAIVLILVSRAYFSLELC
jgi:hypothetical protein